MDRTGRHVGTMMAGVARASRRISGIVVAVLVVTLAGEAPVVAAPEPEWRPSTPAEVAGVATAPITPARRPVWTAPDTEVTRVAAVTWPAADRVEVDLTRAARAADGRDGRAAVKAGGLPVWLGDVAVAEGADVPGSAGRVAAAAAVDRAVVDVADRAAATRAGVSGLVINVNRADGARRAGTVRVSVDYSGFAGAFGGDWSSRLRLVTLPDGRPLGSANNVVSRTVSASVPLSADGTPTMLALSAGPSGDSGDYTATSLSAAGTWQVSQQTGAFGWSHPLRVPPAVGGPEPSLALGYSSSSVDGRTGGTNNQGSWVGDGWDLWPGYIERQYKACADDKDPIRGGQANNASVHGGDLCWLKPEGNATISLNGQATELVRSTGGTWKGVSDNGSKIELLTSGSIGNGDQDGEYWKVTTIDGTQYFFGRHTNPGGASASVATDSVWTVPVYGNHPDEPGYQAGNFPGSRKTKAWRWNLDAVVDPHGNTMTYFYQRETGAYGREGDPAKRTTYHRGGWLTRIEYGNRADAGASTRATAQIIFDVADRCVSNCWSGSDPVAQSWLDTPWDQYCAAAPCADQLSPTFWTGKRLSRIRSQVYTGTGSTYQDVDWWTLRHTYLPAGGNDGQPMWLAGITRTGKVTTAGGTEVTDPEVVFDPGAEALENRVDAMADGRSDLFRHRISTITTESGAQISVAYSPKECQRSALPPVHNNTKRCFPQYYGPDGEEPTLDWFHKYTVTRVDVRDNTGGFDHEQINYDYLDTPAWRYDDSELIDPDRRTWGQFRGYGNVRIRKGLETGVQSATEYRYFRGMHGDKQPTGTRTVSVPDSQGTTVADHDAYAGMLREVTTLLGAGGSWISGTITTPTRQGPTAASGPLKSWMTNVGAERSRTLLADGSTRWTSTTTTYNADNLPTEINDLGEENSAHDDECTRLWYARNPTNWILDKVKRTETVAVDCATDANPPTDTLTSTRVTYDAATNNWDTHLPVTGVVAKTEEIDGWSGSTPVWITTARSLYDANGRSVETYDALNRKNITARTPALAGPVTSTVTTNPLGHTVTTTLAPAWGQPTATVDNANNARIDMTYDGAGRLLRTWLPGRAKTSHPNHPNTEHSYLLRNDAPTAVTSKALTASVSPTYRTQVTLYDGLLRHRQTQTQAPGGGRTLTDTTYDSRGLLHRTTNPYYDQTGLAPGTVLVGPEAAPPPSTVENIHDGAGRVTNTILKAGATEKWRSVAAHSGDRTSVTPPSGATATTTISDPRGNTVELRQYKNPANVGSNDPSTFVRTQYTYTALNELATMTDALGNTWSYGYDQRGRRIHEEDPDTGVTTSTFDAVGQLVTTTNDRDITLAYTYDDLGRRTSVRDGSVTGPKRAEWTYDTLTNGIGRLSKSIRYEPAGSTTAYVTEVASYDTAGRATGTRVTIPASEGGLCAAGGVTPCTYAYTATYRPNGQVATTRLPAAGGLATEQLGFGYNDVGALTGYFSPQQVYLSGTIYNKLGQVTQRILGQDDSMVELGYQIDQPTGRLTNTTVLPKLQPEAANFTYTYDNGGNLTKIADEPAAGSTDTQCYTYDHLRRLTHAWTPSSHDCTTTRTVTGLGGPAPYWHSYTYHDNGNRHIETHHAATNTVRTYTYPTPGGPTGSQPHAVTSVQTTGATTKTEDFTYDPTGNTRTRPGDAGTQTLTWNNENRLATSSDTTGLTSYVYDADGNRLIRRDPTGATLYLPDGTEVRKPTTTSAATATRYYAQAGPTLAIRTLTGLDWLATDHHGTAEATIDNDDLSVARRRTLPFGGTRGTTTGQWPTAMDKGFVGGTQDNTGLTHLGAREYDPHLGAFISVDPIIDITDPQQWHGYAYSNNSPATFTDPTGLAYFEDAYGGGQQTYPNTGPATGGTEITKTSKSTASPIIGGNKSTGATTKGLGALSLDDVARRFYKQNFESLDPTAQSWVLWEAFCYNSPEVCTQIRKDEEEAFRKFLVDVFLEVSGVADATDCAGGSVSGCVWTAVGFVPVGKLLKSGARVGELMLDAGRASNDIPASAFCSFSPDTHVLMADGTTKPIKNIKQGDHVVATDPETGEQGPRPVLHIWVHDDTIIDLRLTSGTIETTEDHPYWNVTDQQWQRADALDPGDLLHTWTGTPTHVEGILQGTARTDSAHNLTIADINTYYVVAGTTPVLVHNCGGAIPRNADGTFASGAGGESAATAAGRQVHVNYRTALGGGYDYEVTLPSGARPDAIDWQNRVVRELKSDAPSNVSRGNRQLARYQAELEEMTGQKWTTVLDIYKR